MKRIFALLLLVISLSLTCKKETTETDNGAITQDTNREGAADKKIIRGIGFARKGKGTSLSASSERAMQIAMEQACWTGWSFQNSEIEFKSEKTWNNLKIVSQKNSIQDEWLVHEIRIEIEREGGNSEQQYEGKGESQFAPMIAYALAKKDAVKQYIKDKNASSGELKVSELLQLNLNKNGFQCSLKVIFK